MIGRTHRIVLAMTSAAALLSGCGPQRVEEAYAPRQERQELAASMEALNLAGGDYAEQWLMAADRAAEQAQAVEVPYRERFVLDPMEPQARVLDLRIDDRGSYRFSAEATTGSYLFMELYRLQGEGYRAVAGRSPDTAEIVVAVRRSGEYRLVVQPEPLRGGEIVLTIERLEAG